MSKAKILFYCVIGGLLCYFYVLGIPALIYVIGRIHQYKIDKKVEIFEKNRLVVRKSPIESDQDSTGGVTIV